MLKLDGCLVVVICRCYLGMGYGVEGFGRSRDLYDCLVACFGYRGLWTVDCGMREVRETSPRRFIRLASSIPQHGRGQ